MVSEILQDSRFQDLVSNAVMIAPASSVDQKNIKLPFGQEVPVPVPLLKDQYYTFRHLEDTANLSVTDKGAVKYTEEKKARSRRTYNALRKKVLKRYEWWKGNMKVKKWRENNGCIVWSGRIGPNKKSIGSSKAKS